MPLIYLYGLAFTLAASYFLWRWWIYKGWEQWPAPMLMLKVLKLLNTMNAAGLGTMFASYTVTL